jgi:glucose-6-phosphate isomerase/transaldolase/glucose-6-phosphate isomerase
VPTAEAEEGEDRYPVQVSLAKPADLGPEFYRFELAAAIIGHVLGVDPFDEPNVAESKRNTDRLLESVPLPAPAPAEPAELPAFLEEVVHPFDYVSIQAYLPFGVDEALEALRRRMRDRLGGLAVTAGYGPRSLHSTGQLNKGGPNTVVALQVVTRSEPLELAIPGLPYDFGTLLAAQAIGDHQSLLARGRRVLRVAADDPNELCEVLAG